MFLSEITMKEFEAGLKKTRTLAVPYGTVEAHGVHLPLSTDTIVMEAVLAEASKKVPLFIAPPVHYGVCTSTGDHPGSLGITPGTLRSITRDIVRDGYEKGFRAFLLLSGHGGSIHSAAMKEAAEELVMEFKSITVAACTIYDMLPKSAYAIAETKNDSHAGELETSLILHIAKRLVKGRSPEEYPSFSKPFIARDKRKYWPGAVWGNPGKASAAKGKKLFDVMVDVTVDVARSARRRA